MFNRRLFIAGAAASGLAAPALVRAQSTWRAYPFSLGVASGDPTSDGFVIWTRIAPDPLAPDGGMARAPIAVEWEVASDPAFRQDRISDTVLAWPELGHSVHVEVGGLKPDQTYYYRFTVAGERSLRGMAKTLPPVGSAVDRMKFGVCGCQHFEQGFFGAYRHLAAEDLAFVYHYGDFIYEYSIDYEFERGLPIRPVRSSGIRGLMNVADFRYAYAQQLGDIDLQAARSRHVFLSSYDDHEVDNNWVGDIDNWWPEWLGPTPPTPQDIFRVRKQAAMQVWYEHMPVRKALMPRGSAVALNRELRFGNLLGMQLLDTRQFRTDQPCDDGFKPACPGVSDPKAEVLGREQEAWLNRNLAAGGSTWNALAQQITMMALDRRRRPEEPTEILNIDSWAGYSVPRERLLDRMAGLKNMVVLTGDEHQNFCGDLVHKDRIVGSEFVATSISSGGSGRDVRPGTEQWMKYNPELKFANDQRGYLTCELSPDAWQTHFMVVDQVDTPKNNLSKRMTATVARDMAGISLSS